MVTRSHLNRCPLARIALTSLAFLALVLATLRLPAQDTRFRPSANSPLARGEHPRLHVSPDTIEALRQKIESHYLDEYRDLVAWVDRNFAATEERRGGLMADYFAFVGLLGKLDGVGYAHALSDYSSRAVDVLVAKASAGTPSTHVTGYSLHDDYQAMARAYDWAWPHLSGSQRSLVAGWLAAAANAQAELIDSRTDLFSSKYFESPPAWYIALAFYGDGYRDAEAQALLDRFATTMLGGRWLDAQNWAARPHGGVTELAEYGLFHAERHILHIDAWRTATRENYFAMGTSLAAPDYMRYFPQYVAYRLMPAQPDLLEKWGQSDADIAVSIADSTLQMLGTPLTTIDPEMASLNRWILDRQGLDEPTFSHDGMLQCLLGDRSAPPRSPRELGLPLTRHFEGTGMVVMRTGFESQDDTLLVVGAPMYHMCGHSWSNFGFIPQGFTLHKFGPLILKRSAYKRGGEHRYSTMRFTDPSTTPDAGYSRVATAPYRITSYTPGSKWDLGGILRTIPFDMTERFDYVFTDQTRCYLDTRVTNFTRQYFWLRPDSTTASDYVVVFDRTETARPEIVKRWELNMAYDPQINGREVKVRAGQWRYEGADRMVVSNLVDVDPYSGNAHPESHGMVHVRTLLPREANIVKAGGPGHEFVNDQGNDTRVAKDDVLLNRSGAQFVGTYHTNVVPQAAERATNFLHVLQTVDARTAPAMVATSLVSSKDGRYEGAWIAATGGQANWATMFARTESTIAPSASSPIVYECGAADATGVTRHLVSDLRAYSTFEIRATNLETGATTVLTGETRDARTRHARQRNEPAASVLTFDVPYATPHRVEIVATSTSYEHGLPPSPPRNLRPISR